MTLMANPPTESLEDLRLAALGRSRALIRAPSSQMAEDLARALHGLGAVTGPFIVLRCAELDPREVEERCETACDAPEDATVFIADIEQLSTHPQQLLMIALPNCRARVIAGTTRDLFRCVESGDFSDQLFYRLNLIYVQADASIAQEFLTAAVRDSA